MIKKIIILFVLLNVLAFSDMYLPMGNGNLKIDFDSKYYQILKKDSLKSIGFENIKIGLIIDNKIYNMRKINPEISYINGTNILKMEGEINKIKLQIYMYTPFDQNESYLNIYTKIMTDEIPKQYDIKVYYEIETDSKKNYVYWNNEKKYCFEKNIRIKSLSEKANFYLATIKNMKDFKLRKVYNKKEKYVDEKIFLITDLGKVDMYETVEDFVVIGNDEKIDEVNSINYRMNLEEEILKWNYWEKELDLENLTQIEKEIVLQNIALLKIHQLENGEIVVNQKNNNMELETKLYMLKAFLKLEYINEVKKGLDYLLKNNELLEEGLNKELQFALYLEILSDYLEKSKDFNYLKENYIAINSVAGKVYNYLEGINNKCELKDVEITLEEKNYASDIIRKSKKYIKTISYFAPQEIVKTYQNKFDNLTEKFNKNQIEIENYGTLKSKLIQIKYLRNNLSENRKEKFTKFLWDYKNELELNERYDQYDINMLVELLITLYNEGMFDKAELLKNRINDIVKSNKNVVPEYLKKYDDVYEYGGENINMMLISKYILMINFRRINGIKE